jgi:hypothetical protein
LRRKLLIAIIVGVAFAALITAMFLPAIAQTTQTSPSTGASILCLTGGVVVLHLPTAGGNLTGRPTDLQITASYVNNGDGVWFGPGNTMQVALWVPDVNAYVPVAQITDNSNPAFLAWLQNVSRGSPLAQNVAILKGNLMVTTAGDIVTVNLAAPVNIKFGDPLPAFYKALNFTLPPFTFEFHPTGAAFATNSVTVNPTSGWSIQSSAIVEPAWTKVLIPQWLGATPVAFDGTINVMGNVTYTPPPQ